MRDRARRTEWLHRLDTFTQETYGRCRSLSAINDECVACGGRTTNPDGAGLCARCSAQRTADKGEFGVFPLNQRSTLGK